MKKMNKKGFTLIELLAVIVILAIIMVIAVPQILNVINDSKKKSWDNSLKLVGEAVELALTTTSFGSDSFTLSECDGSSTQCTDMQTKIFERADITTTDYKIDSISNDSGKWTITMSAPAGSQFKSIESYITSENHNKVTINAASIN